MTDVQPAFNYRYLVDRAAKVGGRILDYGCGTGQIVALGLDRGLDIWGTDTFSGYYASWASALQPRVRERVRDIRNGVTDFPDGHFDLVISNQVLEHVTDPEAVIADIIRTIKPGGLLLAAFPVTETWYEGHVGLYFVHRLRPGSQLRSAVFDISHRLGWGLYRGELTRAEWIKRSERTLDDACFYYPHRRMFTALKNAFGTTIDDIAVDYMRTRLGNRVRYVPDPLLRYVYHKRAGEIVCIRKPI